MTFSDFVILFIFGLSLFFVFKKNKYKKRKACSKCNKNCAKNGKN